MINLKKLSIDERVNEISKHPYAIRYMLDRTPNEVALAISCDYKLVDEIQINEFENVIQCLTHYSCDFSLVLELYVCARNLNINHLNFDILNLYNTQDNVVPNAILEKSIKPILLDFFKNDSRINLYLLEKYASMVSISEYKDKMMDIRNEYLIELFKTNVFFMASSKNILISIINERYKSNQCDEIINILKNKKIVFSETDKEWFLFLFTVVDINEYLFEFQKRENQLLIFNATEKYLNTKYYVFTNLQYDHILNQIKKMIDSGIVIKDHHLLRFIFNNNILNYSNVQIKDHLFRCLNDDSNSYLSEVILDLLNLNQIELTSNDLNLLSILYGDKIMFFSQLKSYSCFECDIKNKMNVMNTLEIDILTLNQFTSYFQSVKSDTLPDISFS